VTEPVKEEEQPVKREGPDVPIFSKPRPAHRYRWVLFLFIAGVLGICAFFGWEAIRFWQRWIDQIMAN
jgi:hypothetical protein